ncbi:glycine oxidase ThiO [Persephonella sp.]
MKGIIIGGGIIGLTIARELSKKNIDITLIEKDTIGRGASWVAGGMLAPQAEGLKEGLFLDFCLEGRDIYESYIKELEYETGINVNYWKCGIFCPAFSDEEEEDLKENIKNYEKLGLSGFWVSQNEIKELYPNINENIIGGAFYPDDGQVDNRMMLNALVKSMLINNVEILEGYEVKEIEINSDKFESVVTDKGKIWGDFCVISAGAWSSEILKIPVFPLKGEMTAIEYPDLNFDRIFFSSKAYIIPRKDKSRVIIGATEENVGFKEGNTVKGILKLLNGLNETFLGLEEKRVIEFWYGYRPSTPDYLPILGKTDINGLYLATGHHRNGILLAPITAKVISDLIVNNNENIYLKEFNLSRFKV